MEDSTPELPLVTARFLVRQPVRIVNFTSAVGGYGTIFNKASIEYLMKPINCPQGTEVCARLEERQAEEIAVFQNGMSLIDLMQAYASQEPYRDHKN
jgi:hypothetical protein